MGFNWKKNGFRLLWCGLAMILVMCRTSSEELPKDDWPQFRGPNRDGIATSTGLLESWPEEGPRLMWKVPIGQGFSGITVAGNMLYTGFAGEDREYLGCYDEATGKELWRLDLGEKFVDEFGDGPRSSPVIDGETVFALSSNGDLHAVDRKTGKALWSVSFPKKFESKVARWGYSMSPLVDGDMLVVEAGGGEGEGIAALNKKTGDIIWTGFDGEVGYSSPVAVDLNGQRQYIFVASKPGDPRQPPKQAVISISKEGALLWEHAIPGFTVAMPLFIEPDKIFISASNDDGCRLLQIKSDSGQITVGDGWQTRFMKNHFNSSIAHKGYIYGFSNATLTCLSADTGEKIWAKRGLGKGSLVLAEDRLIALSDKGKLVLFEASPEGYKEISAFQPFHGKSWTSPTIAGGKMFLRNQKEMAGFDLRRGG